MHVKWPKVVKCNKKTLFREKRQVVKKVMHGINFLDKNAAE